MLVFAPTKTTICIIIIQGQGPINIHLIFVARYLQSSTEYKKFSIATLYSGIVGLKDKACFFSFQAPWGQGVVHQRKKNKF